MSVGNIQEVSKEDEYGSVRLSKNVIRRLQAKGQNKDNFSTIVERLLNLVDGREPYNGDYQND